MKAVILAAGKGVRMMPLTVYRPKPMIPIVNIPILKHIVDGLIKAGVTEIMMVTGYQAQIIEGFFGTGEDLGVGIHYRRQRRPEGTGKATLLAEDFVEDEPFVLAFGDIMTPQQNFSGVVAAHAANTDANYVCTARVEDPSRGAAVYVDDDRIVRIVEKPAPGSSTSDLNNAGIFIFSPEVFRMLHTTKRSERNEYELTDAIAMMIEAGHLVKPYLLEGYWSNVGQPTELMELNRIILDEIAQNLASYGHSPEQVVLVGAGTEISPQAEIRGPVIIGGKCRIGSSLIEEYSCLGDGVSVEDGAHLNWVELMHKSRVGRGSRISSALLGSNVTVREDVDIRGSETQVAVVADYEVIQETIHIH